ncbi:hypothetical protein KXW77_000878, partial [Aspergillus fumigatus]
PILRGGPPATCVYRLGIAKKILAEKGPRKNCYGNDNSGTPVQRRMLSFSDKWNSKEAPWMRWISYPVYER